MRANDKKMFSGNSSQNFGSSLDSNLLMGALSHNYYPHQWVGVHAVAKVLTWVSSGSFPYYRPPYPLELIPFHIIMAFKIIENLIGPIQLEDRLPLTTEKKLGNSTWSSFSNSAWLRRICHLYSNSLVKHLLSRRASQSTSWTPHITLVLSWCKITYTNLVVLT